MVEAATAAIAWGGFITAALTVMLCLNVIIRKRWTEEERLSYPIVQIPLAMTDPKSGFFRNRVMWAGFALAAGIETINGLNYLYPVIPALQYRGDHLDLWRWFPDRPWSAIGPTRADFYPCMIGLGFLLPQAITSMLPVLISQMVVVLKDTAIGYQITFLEMVRQGTQVGSAYGNYIPALIVIAVLMISVNFALSHFAVWMEGRMRRSRRTPEPMHADEPVTQGSFGAGAGGTI